MEIGGHVPTKGGLDKALDFGLAIGAEVIQTHPSPPQQWRSLVLDDAAVDNFRARVEATGLRRHFFHAVYLVNLATRDETLLKRSIGSLASYLRLAGRLGVDGVIFHPGSHKGAGFEPMLPQMGSAILQVLERAGDTTAQLIVENSAGQGGCVGCSFDEVGAILDAAGEERVGVCLDTAHAYANGYELSTAEGIDGALRTFDEQIGLDRLVAVHANDSRVALGANVDRHANIGDGHIGREAFGRMLTDSRLRDLPWILEVPGAGQGPDLEQVNLLRELAGLEPAVAAEVATTPV
ncbi:MAG: deoxyribonuclease IV [Chloroflexi bacterium]|nr:MAG: deoxyribonuclease IV [Chloroflexota bacterium]